MRVKKILFVCLLGVVAMSAVAETPVPLRRFAFVAGSNDGGEALVKLRYAESDARAFAAVMEELGGVRPQDLVLVSTPTLSRFQDALQRIRQMVCSPRELDERRELVIYYSGHSDDDGLILGKDRFTWQDLRDQISDIPADVKVAIIDSCSSGSMTRAKGGVARPAFLFDASETTGHAYITSASAEEAAQESDRIGSSFFTHYLISGLRGAADTAGNGTVTINEAYTYAYKETLASTERTEYGPQHPAYDFNLTGSGDLVLTDLRSASALLTVSDEIAGRLYFRDSQGNLAVELNKTGGQSVDLGLEPGVYSVVLDANGARLAADVRVTSRQRATLTLANMHAVPLDKATARGEEGADAQAAQPQVAGASDQAAALGAAVGAVVGSALGKAAGVMVNAAITAAAAVAAAAPAASPAAAPAASPAAAPASAPAAAPPAAQPDKAGAEEQAASSAPRPAGFQISLIPDFSAGLFSSQVDHAVSINLLVGTSHSLRGFEVGSLVNLESGDISGFQAAGLANVGLGSLSGFQAAGLINYLGGEARFFQSAGLVNVSSGMAGGQAAGLANVSFGRARGAQMAGLFNWTFDEVQGAQLAGIFNVAGREVNGAQAAGIFNWAAGDVSGAQVAGLFNESSTRVSGAQVSGFANLGSSVKGPQISVVNIADDVSGAQIGVVNIARHVSGTQVGVINLSEAIDGIPFGLISIEGRGRHDIDVWMDQDGVAYAGLSLGTRHLYSIFSAGWTPGTVPALWSLGFGLGGQSTLGSFFLDYDLSMVNEFHGEPDASYSSIGTCYPRIRTVAGLTLFGSLAIDAGVAVRVLVPYLSSSLSGADPTRLVFQPTFIFGVHL